MKNEKQLQAAIAMRFSQEYPEKNGQLFSVRNTTLSLRDGNTQKAMGMKAGVSDFVYLDDDGTMVGIEIKFPGKKHGKQHVINQLQWGEVVERCGGEYFIVTSVSGFMSIIKGGAIDADVYNLDLIRKKVEESGSEVRF